MSHGRPRRPPITIVRQSGPPSWKKCFVAGFVVWVVMHFVVALLVVLTGAAPL